MRARGRPDVRSGDGLARWAAAPEVADRDEGNECGEGGLERFRGGLAEKYPDQSGDGSEKREPGGDDSEGGNPGNEGGPAAEAPPDLESLRAEMREKDSPEAGVGNQGESETRSPAREEVRDDAPEAPSPAGDSRQAPIEGIEKPGHESKSVPEVTGEPAVETREPEEARLATPDAWDGSSSAPPSGEDIREHPSESLPDAREAPAVPSDERRVDQSSAEAAAAYESRSEPIQSGQPSVQDTRAARGLDRSPDVPAATDALERTGKVGDGETGPKDEGVVEGISDPREPAEPREPLATFSATAVRQETDGMTRFEVRKDDFENRTGRRLERDKVYAIEGEIPGVGSFRKIYDGHSEGDRLAFFAPKEASDSIRPGEKRDVRIDSVREVSASLEGLGTFFATAYEVKGREGSGGSVRLDIPRATFEKRTGFHFEDGKTVEVKGKIDGEHEFKVTHTGSRENQHVVISFYGGAAEKIEVGKEHTVTAESIEEKRTLTVTGEGSTTRLTPQKRMLESLGIDVDSMRNAPNEHRLVELTVRNLSSADKSEKQVYGRMQPRDGALPLSIGYADGKPGDRFELVRGRRYETANFVVYFNGHRGEATKNVSLSMEGEKLFIEVDGRKFETKSYEVDVWHTRAFLKVEVEPFKREFRFWKDEGEITPKFGQSWRINSFNASDKGLGITYQMGTRSIASEIRSDGSAVPERLDSTRMVEGIRLLRSPEELSGTFRFEVDREIYDHVYGRISASIVMGESKYEEERGNLGEEVATSVLVRFGLKDPIQHPFADLLGYGSHKPGTDLLVKNQAGELLLFEVKWWKESEAAIKKAEDDLLSRKKFESEFQGSEVSGAYMAILDFNPKSRTGELFVKRVW